MLVNNLFTIYLLFKDSKSGDKKKAVYFYLIHGKRNEKV